ncbi:MAG: monooxygenase [Citromicrobium sp.]|nr:MAG: monooxygenase [Citromicrobium sp.]
MKSDEAEVVIVGAGPAGMMAGYLLARAGVRVVVLEKHDDFLRDFRGDTVHPSTMQILDELGLLRKFLARPHNRIDRAEIDWNGSSYTVGDLSHLAMAAPFIAMMPQWDFLEFLRMEAESLPDFALRRGCEVVKMLRSEERRFCGVELVNGERVGARKLVLMCDGRRSLARQELPVRSLGVPIDVFWFSIPKDHAEGTLRGAVSGNRLMVMIDRDSYWQCALVIAKGSAEAIRSRGIAAFRDELQSIAPALSRLEDALPTFDSIKLLSVSLDRLDDWSLPGLLAIGDAAHAMSPVGGVGINLAIQDAVCAANVLAGPLAKDRNVDDLLAKVQRRRMVPTRIIQAGQAAIHRNVLEPLLSSGPAVASKAPLALRLLDRFAILRRIPGYVIGHGIRMEHVRSPALPRG